jgi:DNA-binding NarL/FixJ family response regulator
LLVDDFAGFRRFLRSALDDPVKFHLSEAADGLEAIQKAKEFEPDLILLDIGMPGLNGIEVAKRILKFTVPPKILFLSLESSPDVVCAALSLGAQGYVHKPRAQSDLLPAIGAVLNGGHFVSRGLGVSLDGNGHAGHRLNSVAAATSTP